MAKKVLSIRVEEKTTLIVHMDYDVATPTIHQCIYVSTPGETVSDGLITDFYTLGRRIKSACIDNGIRTKDVIFTLTSSKIASRVVTIPFVAKGKIDSLLAAKAPEHFPVDVEKYTFAHATQGKENVGEDGSRTLDYIVFAAPNNILKSYYDLADAMDCNILALDCDGNSVYQLMKRQVGEKVVLSVQMNRLGTLVNVLSGDQLLVQRTIPYGIASLTDALIIDKNFDVRNFDEAYKLLTSHQVLLPSFDAVGEDSDASKLKRQEVTETLLPFISNINRVIEYYSTKFREKSISGIICTGVGASIIGIHDLLGNTLELEASAPEHFSGLKFSKKVMKHGNVLQYVTCFGATIDPVRFIAKEVLEKRQKRSSTRATVAIFAASIVLCVILAGFSMVQLLDASSTREDLLAREILLKPVQDRYEQLQRIEDSYTVYKLVDDFAESTNNQLHQIIDEIAKQCPQDFKINSIATTEKDITLSVTSSSKLRTVSAVKMKMDMIGLISNVFINSITQVKDEVTNRPQYTYSITFEFANALKKEEGGEK